MELIPEEKETPQIKTVDIDLDMELDRKQVKKNLKIAKRNTVQFDIADMGVGGEPAPA